LQDKIKNNFQLAKNINQERSSAQYQHKGNYLNTSRVSKKHEA